MRRVVIASSFESEARMESRCALERVVLPSASAAETRSSSVRSEERDWRIDWKRASEKGVVSGMARAADTRCFGESVGRSE